MKFNWVRVEKGKQGKHIAILTTIEDESLFSRVAEFARTFGYRVRTSKRTRRIWIYAN